jgi:hypothetical protein
MPDLVKDGFLDHHPSGSLDRPRSRDGFGVSSGYHIVRTGILTENHPHPTTNYYKVVTIFKIGSFLSPFSVILQGNYDGHSPSVIVLQILYGQSFSIFYLKAERTEVIPDGMGMSGMLQRGSKYLGPVL